MTTPSSPAKAGGTQVPELLPSPAAPVPTAGLCPPEGATAPPAAALGPLARQEEWTESRTWAGVSETFWNINKNEGLSFMLYSDSRPEKTY